MAKTMALLKLITIMLVALLAMASMVHSQRQERLLNRRNFRTFTLFFQPTVGGPNADLIIVAGPNGQPGAFGRFGTLRVGGFPATSGVSRDSPIIAQVEGISAETSLNGTSVFLSISIRFLVGELKGSTLQIQGISLREFAPNGPNFGEVAVTGGTGYFRYYGGYAIITTVVQNAATNATVPRYDFTVKEFDD